MNVLVNLENIKLFECLSSSTRVKVIELLGKGPKNVGELAEALNVSSAIMTRHIAVMEECGIIYTESIPGKRGLQKLCHLAVSEITLSFKKEKSAVQAHSLSIPIGQYTAYQVHPTCGLAARDHLIGLNDDPRYFSSPDRINASLLWFQSGWVEYSIPSYMIRAKSLNAIEISLEICSEFPQYKEDWPSDIHFYLNGVLLGIWLSPGDFGNKKGTYTPEWWRAGTQYGLLKTIRITEKGTMLDGIHFSDVTPEQLQIEKNQDLRFRISVPADTSHPGGINIFGKGFGNYDQDIGIRVEYS